MVGFGGEDFDVLACEGGLHLIEGGGGSEFDGEGDAVAVEDGGVEELNGGFGEPAGG